MYTINKGTTHIHHPVRKTFFGFLHFVAFFLHVGFLVFWFFFFKKKREKKVGWVLGNRPANLYDLCLTKNENDRHSGGIFKKSPFRRKSINDIFQQENSFSTILLWIYSIYLGPEMLMGH